MELPFRSGEPDRSFHPRYAWAPGPTSRSIGRLGRRRQRLPGGVRHGSRGAKPCPYEEGRSLVLARSPSVWLAARGGGGPGRAGGSSRRGGGPVGRRCGRPPAALGARSGLRGLTWAMVSMNAVAPFRRLLGDAQRVRQPRDGVDRDRLVQEHHERGRKPAVAPSADHGRYAARLTVVGRPGAAAVTGELLDRRTTTVDGQRPHPATSSPSLATTRPPRTTISRRGRSTTIWARHSPRTRRKSAGEPGFRSARGRPRS